MSDEKSIFAKIVDREIPSQIIYEDDDFIVINDINPQAPVHVLIITKEPFATLEDIPKTDLELQGKMLVVARRMARKLEISNNYKLIMNVGRQIQEVHHVHLHLMGGWNEQESRTGQA